MKFNVRSLWVPLGIAGVAAFAALGVIPNAMATPVPAVTAAAVANPVVGTVAYNCAAKTVNFAIAYPAGHVTVNWVLPGGASLSASFADARTNSFSEVDNLADGSYTLGVTVYPTVGAPGVDFSQKFTVACTTTSPSPTGNPVAEHVVYCNVQSGKLQQGSEDAGAHNPNLVKVGDIADIGGKWNREAANAKWGAQCTITTPTPTTSKPECVTLTDANIDHYGDIKGDQKTYETITLRGKATDYCNDWSFVGVGYKISNPANIWNPAQVVMFVDSKVVGKSGLTATATVPDTTCGQNDWYEGVGPKVGDKLPGQGQGYEATHKFLSQIFGGPNTWYKNVTKCEVTTTTPTPTATETPTNTATPTPSVTVTVTVPKPSETKSTATVPVVTATCAAGKVLYKGNCVLPKDVPSGQGGTPLMSTIGNAAPWGVAALVLGIGGVFLYRRARVVV